MGAWIETVCASTIFLQTKVALYMGAWIETSTQDSKKKRA